MAILARADVATIEACLATAPPLPSHVRLRGSVVGLVMVRGRAGGSGAPFNLGEMTVTRCTVRNAGGLVGHAYIAGRDLRWAELAAALDAALVDPARQSHLPETVIEPLAAGQVASRANSAAKVAATRVDFPAWRPCAHERPRLPQLCRARL